MSPEERILRLENAFATLEELAAKSEIRTSDLEEHFKMLTQLAVSASERADTHESWINSLGTRMQELAELQRQTDARIAALVEAQRETEARLSELAEAQKQTSAHLSVLASIMQEVGRAQARTERALASLTERFEQYISSRP